MYPPPPRPLPPNLVAMYLLAASLAQDQVLAQDQALAQDQVVAQDQALAQKRVAQDQVVAQRVAVQGLLKLRKLKLSFKG